MMKKKIPRSNSRRKAICDQRFPIPAPRYYDLQRHWTARVEPHLSDKRVNAVLVRDFNKFTFGRWGQRFRSGHLLREFESCDWSWEHRGPEPRYWKYVKHAACNWLVNFNLRLAQAVEPSRPWRIVTSPDHSTVWDGDETLFDFNFLALGIMPEECFSLANKRQLAPGKELRVYQARHFSEDDRKVPSLA